MNNFIKKLVISSFWTSYLMEAAQLKVSKVQATQEEISYWLMISLIVSQIYAKETKTYMYSIL